MLTPEEQRKRFEEEVRKRETAGDFDPDVADATTDRLVRHARDNREHGEGSSGPRKNT